MFAYTYDSESGGILLNNSVPQISNEPRPVYCTEMNLLGFDKYWAYEDQLDTPYMWAENNRYIYRGLTIAKTVGGSLIESPELEISSDLDDTCAELGSELHPIDMDLMLSKNEDLILSLKQFTVKKIFDTYSKHKSKVDYFHVAFSGGKDSLVLLDLVKNSIPKNEFMVIFGDTGMEFPDTYKLVDQIEEQCKSEGIAFHRAKSHLDVSKSWLTFGPPSSRLRWCCSVHKTAPQTLKIRELLGKTDYVGLDFVGVRANESLKRSTYEYENYGKKMRGQYSHNSILEWSSAEIWLYIFYNNLLINEAYKKGNSRAGCLLCPNSGGKADFFRISSYPEGVNKFINLINCKVDNEGYKDYLKHGAWTERINGRNLKNNPSNYEEEIIGNKLVIHVTNPTTDWMEWIKTISPIPFEYDVVNTNDGIDAIMPAALDKTTSSKLFKIIFHKTAKCIGCRVCEANCPHGCISFEGKLHITDCKHCGLCNSIPEGCVLFKSVQLPKNGEKRMKSLNSFADHAPKQEWIQEFIDHPESFFESNSLGPMQEDAFKKFLTNGGLIDKKKNLTEFYTLINKLGWETEQAWALIYINLVFNNPQIHWYVLNLPLNVQMSRYSVEESLKAEGMVKRAPL